MANPVAYAEQTLGVHQPWEEVQSRLASHATALATVVECKRRLRDIKNKIEDRQMEVTGDAPTLIPTWETLNLTMRKESIKLLLHSDDEIGRLEEEVDRIANEQDIAESQARHHELGIRALTARMEELAGLLAFYTAAKKAKTS